MITLIPFDQISKIEIYVNSERKSLAQIKKETKANYIINGTLYDMSTYKAVCHLKANNKIYCKPNYTTWGYSWTKGNDIDLTVVPNGKANNIACVYIIQNGKAVDFNYDSALGGKRGRTAIGRTNRELVLFCTGDGTSDAMTPEALQMAMMNLGCVDAIMLDGGGSSQCDFLGNKVTSSRKVQNLILVYAGIDEETEDEKESETKMAKKVMLDPGHDASNANGSPDGTYKEHEFALDMGKRVKAILERCGVEVSMTRTDGSAVSLSQRCKMANAISDLDLFVSIHSNAAGGSGWSSAKGLSTYIYGKGGNAEKTAKALVARFEEAGITLRSSSIVVENFQVLRDTVAPAVLIEHGFHTNKDDVALLKTDDYRQKLAVAEAKGILDHLGLEYVEAEDEDEKEEAATTPSTPTTSTHWAQANFDNLVARGIQLSETRFDDNITRGEAFALADKILTALGK